MKWCVLMGSPRKEGNTAALLGPFLEECGALGVEAEVIWLYDRNISPCLGCMACQDVVDRLGCVQKDGFAAVFQSMADCGLILLATPIYSFFCTAPMKALLDRAIYAGVKNYGREKGPKLLAGKGAATPRRRGPACGRRGSSAGAATGGWSIWASSAAGTGAGGSPSSTRSGSRPPGTLPGPSG